MRFHSVFSNVCSSKAARWEGQNRRMWRSVPRGRASLYRPNRHSGKRKKKKNEKHKTSRVTRGLSSLHLAVSASPSSRYRSPPRRPLTSAVSNGIAWWWWWNPVKVSQMYGTCLHGSPIDGWMDVIVGWLVGWRSHFLDAPRIPLFRECPNLLQRLLWCWATWDQRVSLEFCISSSAVVWCHWNICPDVFLIPCFVPPKKERNEPFEKRFGRPMGKHFAGLKESGNLCRDSSPVRRRTKSRLKNVSFCSFTF